MLVLLVVLLQLLLLLPQLVLLLLLLLLLQCRLEHAVHFFEHLGSILLFLRFCESFSLSSSDVFFYSIACSMSSSLFVVC